MPKIQILNFLQENFHATHLLKLLDKLYKYEFPSMFQKKKKYTLLTKNGDIQATSDQCATCQMKSSDP